MDEWFQEQINYSFKDKELLEQSLTSNAFYFRYFEPLAALGDSVIKLFLVERALNKGLQSKHSINNYK